MPLQFCTPIAAAWLVGGGKVTPIALFDDNPYSSQPEGEEEEEDEDSDPTVVGGAAQSSVYLGKMVKMDNRPLLYFNRLFYKCLYFTLRISFSNQFSLFGCGAVEKRK